MLLKWKNVMSRHDMSWSLVYLTISLAHLTVFWSTLRRVYDFSHSVKEPRVFAQTYQVRNLRTAPKWLHNNLADYNNCNFKAIFPFKGNLMEKTHKDIL